MGLDEIRAKIDEIDGEIIKLFDERMECAKQVAEFKKNNAVPVLQSGREEEVIAKAQAKIANDDLRAYVPELMNCLMELSKDYQRRLYAESPVANFDRESLDNQAAVGYFGEVGSNTQRAALEYFGKEEAVSFSSFEEIFEAVSTGKIKYGVLPIENSSTGAITDVYDLLGKYNLYIVGEKWLRIEHSLLAKKGVNVQDVIKVYSHPQALSQCKEYLQRQGMQVCDCASTSAACKMIAANDESGVAAIADKSNASRYGLEVVEENVATCKDNFTRFVVVAKTLLDIQSDKVSVHFVIKNKVGSLFNALRIFARYKVNMVMIESRPIKNNPKNYSFYVDLEGNCNQNNVRLALEYLQQNSTVFKIIGEYKSGEVK
ncbi:MAG: prephenate dehydratase [Christensenellales bacterium]